MSCFLVRVIVQYVQVQHHCNRNSMRKVTKYTSDSACKQLQCYVNSATTAVLHKDSDWKVLLAHFGKTQQSVLTLNESQKSLLD
eukprot:1143247-Pelagomonas_calceolata.AAC.6